MITLPRGFSATGSHRIDADDEPDFYPTAPWGGRAGGELIRQLDPLARSCWEPACGAGHMVHALRDYFPRVEASDLHDYNGNRLFDFVRPAHTPPPFAVDWIVSNPPFQPGAAFVRQGLALARRGVAVLVRSQFEESKGRFDLLHGAEPYAVRAPFSERLAITKGRWEPDASTAAAYSWVIWLKPVVRSPAARLARHARRIVGAGLTMPIPPGTEARLTRPSDQQFAMRQAA